MRLRVDPRARVLLAGTRETQAVPVVMTTTMVIQGERPDELWVVRMWRVAMFYPTPEQDTAVISRRI